MIQKCPFAAALISGLAGCRHAEQVVRRGGSEYDCRSEPDHRACQDLFERLKAAALPAFGVDDDLATMPHSVLVKVQCGGLLGLARLAGAGAGGIVAIADLRARSLDRSGGPEGLPLPELVQDMTTYRTERRGRRR